MTNEKIDSIATTVIFILVFLLPIFFIPILSIPFQSTKIFLLIAGVLITAILWCVTRLRSSEITLPRSYVVIPIILLPIITLASALFSDNFLNSLIGQGFELDTVLMMSVLSTAFFLGIFLFTSKDRIIKLYVALVASALVFFLYQIVRLFFGNDFLSFNMFFGSTANLIGKWNDVAIFSGLIALLSLITLDLLRPQGVVKIMFYGGLVASMFMLAVVNFSTVWVVLAILSFLLFVRSFLENKYLESNTSNDVDSSVKSERDSKGVSGAVMSVLIISILFIFMSPIFGSFISNIFNVFQVEARPSWQSTFTIAKESYVKDPVFGAGPNNFTKEWLLNKPVGINETPFWNVNFSSGVGIVPTMFVTNGILSVFAWVSFFILFLWGGIRMFTRFKTKLFDNYLLTSSFFSAVFLWAVSIFYVPHTILFFLAFLFSGIFVAAQIESGVVKQFTINFGKNLRAGFVGIVLLFMLIFGFSVGLYIATEKFASDIYVQHARVVANTIGDLAQAEKDVNQALVFSKTDQVYRAAAEVYVLQLSELINTSDGSEQAQLQFRTILTKAVENGRLAVSVDDGNYQNWNTLGQIYEALISLQVNGAYENAKVAYEQAIFLNPQSPELRINLARIEVSNGNNDAARNYIAEALNLKRDYTNAIFLLSQIEINEGKVDDAIKSIEAASILTPTDPLVFFQLGLLKYSENDFSGAIQALNNAVVLDPQYSNARYFLGLSYYRIDRIDDAVEQFNIVGNLNPENSEIRTILENLNSGRAPFENITPPTDPLLKEELPLEE